MYEMRPSDWLRLHFLKNGLSYGDDKVCFGIYRNGKCNNYDVTSDDSYTQFEVLLLTDAEGCSAPESHDWSPCSTTCGIGISTYGNKTRTCHAVCETSPGSNQYCRRVLKELQSDWLRR